MTERPDFYAVESGEMYESPIDEGFFFGREEAMTYAEKLMADPKSHVQRGDFVYVIHYRQGEDKLHRSWVGYWVLDWVDRQDESDTRRVWVRERDLECEV